MLLDNNSLTPFLLPKPKSDGSSFRKHSLTPQLTNPFSVFPMHVVHMYVVPSVIWGVCWSGYLFCELLEDMDDIPLIFASEVPGT